MNLLHEVSDPFLDETLRSLARKALESTKMNARIDFGSVTLSCTANTTATKAVSFNRQFSSTPVLFLFVNPSVATSKNTASYTSLSTTGFTAQCNSDTTQSVTISYIAIG